MNDVQQSDGQPDEVPESLWEQIRGAAGGEGMTYVILLRHPG